MTTVENKVATTETTITPINNYQGRRMWPSSETANLISNIANIFLVISLGVGVVATFLVVWMGNVKEEYLKRELANSKVLAENAGKDAALAHGKIANANERTATLEKHNLGLQTNLERERSERLQLEARIAPRRLTREMQSAIAASLTIFSGRKVLVKSYASDVEAAVLGEQIIDSLKAANINVLNNLLSQSSLGSIGLAVHVSGSDKNLTAHLRKSFSTIGNLDVSPYPIPMGTGMYAGPDDTGMDAVVFIGGKPITQ